MQPHYAAIRRDSLIARCMFDSRFASALMVAHVTTRWASGESVRFPSDTCNTLAYLKNDGMFLTFNLAHLNSLGYVTGTDTLDVGVLGLRGWAINARFRDLAKDVYREFLRYHGAGL